MADYPGLKGRLFARWGEFGLGVYSAGGCLLTIALAGGAAVAAGEPMLVPSLGPTVLLFFESALQPAACPRNAFIGHGIAIAAGWVSLALFGLVHAPSVLVIGFTLERVAAAALALAATAFIKHLFRAPHPPAGATVLIVSLGMLTTFEQLGWLAASVAVVTAASWIVNHLLGVPMPLWGPRG